MASLPKKPPESVATLAHIDRAAGVALAAASAVLQSPAHLRVHSAGNARTHPRGGSPAPESAQSAARARVSRRRPPPGVAAHVEGGERNHRFLELFGGLVAPAADDGQTTAAFALRDLEGGAASLWNFCDERLDETLLIAPTFDPAQVPRIPLATVARPPLTSSFLKMASAKKITPVRAATLADVGRAAGVSAMAVSAVLNGARTSSRIAAETRERILEAAARLRYRPNAAARALANRRMDTLGVAAVIDRGELNHYFLEVFNGILEAAARHEQNTTVFTLHDWGHDPARLHAMCDGRIDGLILIAPTLRREAARLLPAHTPFVALHANTTLPSMINIETDEERGAFEMVRHLIANGHRRIMHVAGPVGLIGAERRVHGYKRALASARIPFDETLLVQAEFNQHSGHDAMRAWLRRHEGDELPQAIFSVSDGVAVGCMEALAEVGLRVPDDISIAGFDDTLAARATVPQLTTVRQPLRAMGSRAVDLLLARIAHQNGEGPAVPGEGVVFPVDIVPRASVAAPPAARRIVPPHR